MYGWDWFKRKLVESFMTGFFLAVGLVAAQAAIAGILL